MLNPTVDLYFAMGCMRCPLGGTPNCKVHNWQEELETLRSLVLEYGLTEDLKWGVPCYTYPTKENAKQETNIIILGAFKEYCVISFINGALLKDEHQILQKPGENSQAGRVIRFTSIEQVHKIAPLIKAYIFEALENEKGGLKPEIKKNPEPIPEEFQQFLDQDFRLKESFESLTPGRQREYILHFSAPKQSKTRISRIEKSIDLILKGKGLMDHYRQSNK